MRTRHGAVPLQSLALKRVLTKLSLVGPPRPLSIFSLMPPLSKPPGRGGVAAAARRVAHARVKRQAGLGTGCGGRLSKAGPETLRWVVVEAAQAAWRPKGGHIEFRARGPYRSCGLPFSVCSGKAPVPVSRG